MLFGIAVATRRWADAGLHLLPIIAFFFGVLAAYWVKSIVSKKDERRAGLLTLLFEIIVLIIVATLPQTFPDAPIILIVAFVAAVQATTFTKLEVWSYNSVMTTGNLRKATESLFEGLSSAGNHEARSQAWKFAAVCLTFCVGAGMGAVATRSLSNIAAIGGATLLGCALYLSMLTARKEK